MGHNKRWKILKEMGIPDHLTCLLENYMQVRKQQLELDMNMGWTVAHQAPLSMGFSRQEYWSG